MRSKLVDRDEQALFLVLVGFVGSFASIAAGRAATAEIRRRAEGAGRAADPTRRGD